MSAKAATAPRISAPLPANDARLLLRLADLLEGSGHGADGGANEAEAEAKVGDLAGN